MSQTSANVDANVNPGYADICIKDCSHVELLDGWEHWSLEDIIRIIESIKEKGRDIGLMPSYLALITLNKLLKAADDPNVSFDLIEKTVHVTLRANITLINDNIFQFACFLTYKKAMYDFFRKFIKYGKRDARYYDLIYEMLTHQTVENKSFPLGYRIPEECKWFKDEILSEFPPAMQEKLKSEGFYAKGGDVYYSLLTGASVGMWIFEF